MGVDLAPLVAHPHHMVHTAALAAVVQLGRGLRGDFFDLVGGQLVFRLLVARCKEKRLRPALARVLDALFDCGAVPLDRLIDSDLPNLLDPTVEENKPVLRQCVWAWLVRCCDRADPAPDPAAAMAGETPPRSAGRYGGAASGGGERLCGSAALKLQLLALALRGMEQVKRQGRDKSWFG